MERNYKQVELLALLDYVTRQKKMLEKIAAYVNQPAAHAAEVAQNVGEMVEANKSVYEEITSSNPGNQTVSIGSGEDAVIYRNAEDPASYQRLLPDNSGYRSRNAGY